MPKIDPLRFIADHAGMALVDAISEAYRQGQQDAQHVPDTNDGDTISRQAAIEIVDFECGGELIGTAKIITKRLSDLPSAQPEPLTDKEQRIFLAAMGREEEVCRQVDAECRDCREPYEDSLVSICHEIIRKVKGTLWDGN